MALSSARLINGGAQETEWPDECKQGAVRVLLQHRELVMSLAHRDIRARYKQSLLGVAWALLQPLAMMIVYTWVFSHIAKMESDGIPYPIFSYIALLPWTFFSGALTQGTECLVGNANLITKIYFPREVFPISAVLGRTVDLMLGALVLIPLFFIYHIQVTWMLLLVVPVVVLQTCLLLGVTFAVSAFNLFYRDIRHVVPLLLQIWMYASPIIYPLSQVDERYLGGYMILNPMSSFMDSYRKLALQGESPMWGYLAIAGVTSIVALIIGYRIFKRLEPAFAETV